ncbi:hypothetical protein, partial [Liquorilactobacillus satsumensis]|uniref:hypothetical protein n=1 Tax=Liquorilactobacillus satsumensis TaxID=259059 RepID=UPI0039EB20E4
KAGGWSTLSKKCRHSAFSRRGLRSGLQSNLNLVTRNAGLGTGGCCVEHVKEEVSTLPQDSH